MADQILVIEKKEIGRINYEIRWGAAWIHGDKNASGT